MKLSRIILLSLMTLILLGSGLTILPIRAATPTASEAIYLPLLACPGCTGTGTGTTPPSDPDPRVLALTVVDLVNRERVQVGCPAAVVSPNLMAATQAWSEHMVATSTYQHADASWYAPYGFPGGVLENIGGGGPYPDLIVQAWMQSTTGHRENLLDCVYNDPDNPSYDPSVVYVVGVGYADGYWTFGLTPTFP